MPVAQSLAKDTENSYLVISKARKITKRNYSLNFNSVSTSQSTIFYRRLKGVLDLGFLYPLTKSYYGASGQKSIDPVVFLNYV